MINARISCAIFLFEKLQIHDRLLFYWICTPLQLKMLTIALGSIFLKEKACFFHFLTANKIKCMLEIHTHAAKGKQEEADDEEVVHKINYNLTVAAKQIPQSHVSLAGTISSPKMRDLAFNAFN